MIPKIIHYCWFGGSEIPNEYKVYIDDWKELHPDWEIKRWDETNSPMDLSYMQNALDKKNWANMSNLTRIWAIEKDGGIYLDTDMKLLQTLDRLLEKNCFFGFEEGNINKEIFWVNNAIFGATKGNDFIRLCYNFILGNFDGLESANESSPKMITHLLKKEKGLSKYGEQLLDDIYLYPTESFYPISYDESFKLNNFIDYISESTIAIHMWGRSWMSKEVLIAFIDELQRIRNENNLTIFELTSKLSSSEQTNLNHQYDKGLLISEIDYFSNKIKLLENKINEDELKIKRLSDTIEESEISNKGKEKFLLEQNEFLNNVIIKQKENNEIIYSNLNEKISGLVKFIDVNHLLLNNLEKELDDIVKIKEAKIISLEERNHEIEKVLEAKIIALEEKNHEVEKALNVKIISLEEKNHKVEKALEEKIISLEEKNHKVEKALEEKIISLEEKNHEFTKALEAKKNKLFNLDFLKKI